MLFAHGSRFGGHALYIKDRKLKYVYNFVGLRGAGRRVDRSRADRARRDLRVVRAGRRLDARRGDADAAHPRGAGRRRQDQDAARQVLDRRRGAQHRQGGRRAGHRRLPGRVSVAVRRRHDPSGGDRRERNSRSSTSRWRRGRHSRATDARRARDVAGRRGEDGDRRLRRAGDGRGRGGLRPARRADRRLRQRRHALVRETDADRARLHPQAPCRDVRPGRVAADPTAVAGSLREGLRLARRDDHEALPRRRRPTHDADERHPPGVRRPERRGLLARRRRLPARGEAPDPRPDVQRVRLRTDDRAPPLPRGERVHELHRLGRRPRLHATRHRGRLRHLRPSA